MCSFVLFVLVFKQKLTSHVLTNIISNEFVQLPDDVIWDITFDEEGWAVVEAVGGTGPEAFWRSYEDYEPLLIEDLLTYDVYKGKGDGYHIIARGGCTCRLFHSHWAPLVQAL